jgi:formylglycine-generating enzyme required for sulfatase activity
MVELPPGQFIMGSPMGELLGDDNPATRPENSRERPLHKVTITGRIAIGRYDVTMDEWDACVAAAGCNNYQPPPLFEGKKLGRYPVTSVSWDDAQAYVRWLSRKTGKPYRLPSEAEWEYAARAGTTTAYYTGSSITAADALFIAGKAQPTTVGHYRPNPFGLYDMAGLVEQWTQDCINFVQQGGYINAPTDGSVWSTGDCTHHWTRGGNLFSSAANVRSGRRMRYQQGDRRATVGFRVALTIDPGQ